MNFVYLRIIYFFVCATCDSLIVFMIDQSLIEVVGVVVWLRPCVNISRERRMRKCWKLRHLTVVQD